MTTPPDPGGTPRPEGLDALLAEVAAAIRAEQADPTCKSCGRGMGEHHGHPLQCPEEEGPGYILAAITKCHECGTDVLTGGEPVTSCAEHGGERR